MGASNTTQMEKNEDETGQMVLPLQGPLPPDVQRSLELAMQDLGKTAWYGDLI